ncbi:hypothetical protein GCM10010218_41600 [Streptomyces mashuensis]|uniref:DUF4243 domain-containing protein n=1 Tax=Streptomyces mashuensis TaxID=33904 RepID=A0A919EEQ9_9ACTN|nr:questin oxidase family protein [Streptomyces mashuensis]GHF55734.1 hypothetical protein GCM10010218_41600 [Streptomyces mashuensis]
MPTTGYTDALNDALDRMTDLGYERGVGADLANHGPMGAEALAALGHGDEVAAWVECYRTAMPHHEVPARGVPLDPADESSWRAALGDFSRAGDWEELFARELAAAPWREVLVRWWPRLLPGLLAGLTHGLIRTAHAVRSLAAAQDRPTPAQLTELSRGLAYWAARFAHLPGEVRMTGTQDLASAVAALPRTPYAGERRGRAAAAHRLAHPAELPGYSEALTALAPATGHTQWLLTEMTTEFAGVYLGHPELFPVPLIHGVTAPAAARLVLPHLPEPLHEPTLAALWHTHTTLLLAFTEGRAGEAGAARQAREVEAAGELPPFDELVARAVDHGDEHVVKFTEACLREHALRPDPRYPAAVLAAQQRIKHRPAKK